MRTFALVALAVSSALALARCAGCSEECSGDNKGTEGCPCASDQDCITQLGIILLCTEGTCVVGDPPPAPAELGACNAVGECGDGLACGIDAICFVAPSCQRIDVALSYVRSDGASGELVSARDDCSHTWSDGDALDAAVTIDLEGAMAFADAGCSGTWHAADRLGVVTCGALTWAIAPSDVATCVGDCGAACTIVEGDVGVCP